MANRFTLKQWRATACEEAKTTMSLAMSVPLARVHSGWALLAESLLAERQFLSHQVYAALRHGQDGDRSLRFGTVHKEMADTVVHLLCDALTQRAAPNGDRVAYVQSAAESWAVHGIGVDDLVCDWHTGVDAAVAQVRETGRQFGVGDGELLQFLQTIHAWSQAAVVAAVRGHGAADVERVHADSERCEAFVRGVLFGTLSNDELQAGVEAYGLDPAAEYVAMRARLGDLSQRRKLEQAIGFRPGRGLTSVVDGALVGFVATLPPADACAVVGVGPRRGLRQLPESYRLASRALTTMQAFGLRGARDFGAVSLQAAIVGDPDVGEVLRQRYLEPLSVGDSARELLGTLRAFFACDLHVERTATQLFVHQNTVRYRLARFEELTGASLRSTHVVVELWWALALSDLGA